MAQLSMQKLCIAHILSVPKQMNSIKTEVDEATLDVLLSGFI